MSLGLFFCDEYEESIDRNIIVKYYLDTGTYDDALVADFLQKYTPTIKNPYHEHAQEYCKILKKYIMEEHYIPLCASIILKILLKWEMITHQDINTIYKKIKIEQNAINSVFSQKLRNEGHFLDIRIYEKYSYDGGVEDYAYNQSFLLDEILDEMGEWGTWRSPKTP